MPVLLFYVNVLGRTVALTMHDGCIVDDCSGYMSIG